MPSSLPTSSSLVSGAQHPKTSLYAGFLNGAQSWQEIQTKIQALPTSLEKGDAFEAIMAALIVTDPAKQIRQAWFPSGKAPADLWQRLGLPISHGDKGIDGLAVDANGQTIAIQFKFRSDTSKPLNWSNDKLGNFFGMSNQVDVAWLMTNAAEVNDNGQRHDHQITTLLPDLQKLTSDRFQDALAWMTGNTVTFQRKIERPDQLQALDSISKAFRGETVQTFASEALSPSVEDDLQNSVDEDPDDLDDEDHFEETADVVVAPKHETTGAQSRVTVVSACGTGKTLIAERAVERSIQEGGRNFVVFVPSISLIDQTVDAWTREWAGDPALKNRMRYLAVCSDETVGDTQDDRTTMRVNELGIPSVTTNAEDLTRFLTSSPVLNGQTDEDVRVVFATYQSSEVVQNAVKAIQEQDASWSFDLGVLDEAHKTAVQSTSKAEAKNQMFSRALHDASIPIRQRISMTATPRIRRAPSKDGERAAVAYSMDNEALYGPIVHRYTFHQAVQDKVIAPYKIVVSMVSHDEAQSVRVTVRGDDGQERQLSLEEAANRLAVAKAIQTTGAQRVLTFHGSIKDAEQFVAPGYGVGGVLTQLGQEETDDSLQGWDTLSIKGTDSVAKRDSILQGLRDHGRSLRSNARVLIEGLDVPAVDMVAFLGKQSSATDIVQTVGRAARKYEGKQEGYVVVPVIYGQGQNMDNALAEAQDRNDGMGNLFTLLSALMDHDQDLTKVINDLQTARVSGNSKAIDEATRAFGQRVGVVNSSSSKDSMLRAGPLDLGLQELSIMMTQRVVERLADPFLVGLGKLDRFIQHHHHSDVPSRYKEDGDQGFRLGAWLDNRRTDYKNGRLSDDRIAMLKERKISWHPLDENFLIGLNSLDRFIQHHKHSNVPNKYKEEGDQGFMLGMWLTNRRADYKNGRLSDDRIALLKEREISLDPLGEKFLIGLKSLDRFIQHHKHSNVPQKYKENDDQGFMLGKWLNNRRTDYKKGRLSDDYIAMLKEREISLDPLGEKFLIGIQYFDRFIEHHHHSNVPQRYKEEGDQGFRLGAWLDKQRQEFKNGLLDDKRVAALNARDPFWLTGGAAPTNNTVPPSEESAFWKNIASLGLYKSIHSSLDVPITHKTEDGLMLGLWLRAQCKAMRDQTLPETEMAVLNALGVHEGMMDNLVKFATKSVVTPIVAAKDEAEALMDVAKAPAAVKRRRTGT